MFSFRDGLYEEPILQRLSEIAWVYDSISRDSWCFQTPLDFVHHLACLEIESCIINCWMGVVLTCMSMSHESHHIWDI
jgi:hypothetical protein